MEDRLTISKSESFLVRLQMLNFTEGNLAPDAADDGGVRTRK